MGVTSGRTKAVELVLEAEAVLITARREVGRILAGLDAVKVADMGDDPLWKEADDHLSLALELQDATDVMAEILKGQRALRAGMQRDFGDATVEQVKAALVPYEKGLEKNLERLKRLAAELDGKKAGKEEGEEE